MARKARAPHEGRRLATRAQALGVPLLASLLLGCAAPRAPETTGAGAAPVGHTAYVVRRGWHTDIAVARAAVDATGLIPEAADFPHATLLEFGWGDRAYYMADAPDVALALRAALRPTPAVLHVAPVAALRPGPDIAGLDLSPDALKALVRAIAASFDRPAARATAPLAQGLSEGALFYPARGRFHLFNTCNSWAAGVLAAAGLDVDPAPWSADALMRGLRRGRRASPRPRSARDGVRPREGARSPRGPSATRRPGG